MRIRALHFIVTGHRGDGSPMGHWGSNPNAPIKEVSREHGENVVRSGTYEEIRDPVPAPKPKVESKPKNKENKEDKVNTKSE